MNGRCSRAFHTLEGPRAPAFIIWKAYECWLSYFGRLVCTSLPNYETLEATDYLLCVCLWKLSQISKEDQRLFKASLTLLSFKIGHGMLKHDYMIHQISSIYGSALSDWPLRLQRRSRRCWRNPYSRMYRANIFRWLHAFFLLGRAENARDPSVAVGLTHTSEPAK